MRLPATTSVILSSALLASVGCSADAGPSTRVRSSSSSIEAYRMRTVASPEAPAETVARLQACADQYATRLSAESYGILFDIQANDSGQVAAVKINGSMLEGSDVERCLVDALEHMSVPASTIALGQSAAVSSQSRQVVGIVQTAAAPIALLPIVLVAGGVTILVGVAIYVTAETIDAATRYRPKPNLNRCLDAAAGGTALWQELCRAMTNKVDGEACWSRDGESEQNKRNWCFGRFGR